MSGRKRHASEPALPTPKRQRIVLTLKQKLDLISESDSCSQAQLASKYGIGRSSVSDIVKRKDFYKYKFSQNANVSKPKPFAQRQNSLKSMICCLSGLNNLFVIIH